MNLSLMRLLARLLSSDHLSGRRAEQTQDAGYLLGGALLTILLCALSRNGVFTFSVVAAELLILAFMDANEIRRVFGTVLPASGAAVIFMLPAVFMGSFGSFGTVVLKVFESVLILSILRERISWKELTASLGRWHVPDVVILTLDMTIRFLTLLGRYSNLILEAVGLRKVGEDHWRSSGLSGILGNTFLKSRQLAGETGEAMACRCWDGDFRKNAGVSRRSVRIAAAAYSTYTGIVLWFIITQSWM